ncbi:MAG TPA: hypothetical protein VM325_17940 [Alphaproteobacteria bacterium]|nr:hypothetical protein [Alphaproteobacteria bacterium]
MANRDMTSDMAPDMSPEAAQRPGKNVGENLAEIARRRLRGRNLALLGVLGGMALLFYLLTFVIMGGRGA